VVTLTWFNNTVNILSLTFICSIAREPNWPGQKFIGSPLAREGLVSIISHQQHPYKSYWSALRLFTACTGGECCSGCVCTSQSSFPLTTPQLIEWSKALFCHSGQKGPGFESHPGQELPLVDRSCISLMCYAASTISSNSQRYFLAQKTEGWKSRDTVSLEMSRFTFIYCS
jgi:hypothetical protein